MKSKFFLIFILIASFIHTQQVGSTERKDVVEVPPKVTSAKFISEIFVKKTKPETLFVTHAPDQSASHPKSAEENIKKSTEKEETTNVQIMEYESENVISAGPNICMYKFRDIFLFQSSVIFDEVTLERNLSTMDSKEKKEDLVEKPQEKRGIDWEMDSMQSFEEWKKLKLQQQEEKKEKLVPHIPPTLVRAKKSQVNYASQDCGAKILSHNKEAKHVSAILDENRDLYMLNPCSASIWFVIELCEPIQVEELQLCNLELFSSAPKDFTVSLSERFPAREWHSVGTFHANNVRQLQAFVPNTDTKMFAKYIKFDMIDHFSHEHFCPLTLVRILGVSMADEFDTDQPNTKDDVTDQDPQGEQEKKIGDNGPINTMINMVKNAMDHVLNGAETEESVGGGQLTSEVDTREDDTVVNTTESELVLVVNETELSDSFDSHRRNRSSNQLSEKYDNLRMFSNIPLYMPNYIKSVNPLKNQFKAGMCWILEFFCKVSLAGCLVHYPAYYSAGMTFLSFSNYNISSMYNGNLIHDTVSKESKNDAITNLDLKKNPDEQSVKKKEVAKQTLVNEEPAFIKTVTHQDNSSSSETNKPNLLGNSEEKPKQGVATGSIDNDSSGVQESKQNVKIHSSLKPNENEDKVVGEVNDESEKNIEMTMENYKELPNNDQNRDANVENDTALESADHQEDLSFPQLNLTQNSNVSTQPHTATDQAHVSPTVIINSAVNQKDSVFMRLSNRIRALEENMSLSSDYLETLSQRYKKQMDEMQRAFNQTTTRLLSTAKTANENDAKQTELINLTQRHIREMDQRIQDLSLAHEQLNFILVERHLSLLLIEIFVFVASLFVCVGRQMRHLQKKVETAENMIEVLQRIMKKYEESETNRSLQIPFSIDLTKGFSCHPKQKKFYHSKKLRKKKESRSHPITNIGNGRKTSPSQQKLRVKENTGACEDLPCTAKESFSDIEYKTWKVHPLSVKNIAEHDKGRK